MRDQHGEFQVVIVTTYTGIIGTKVFESEVKDDSSFTKWNFIWKFPRHFHLHILAFTENFTTIFLAKFAKSRTIWYNFQEEYTQFYNNLNKIDIPSKYNVL